MRHPLLSAAALCVAFAASTADAQTCQGYSSFSAGPLRVGGDLGFGNDVSIYAADLSYSPRGNKLFIGGALGAASFDGLDGTALALGGQGGYQIEVKSMSHQVQVCPVASIQYLSGPSDINGSGIDMSTLSFQGGMQVGARFRGSPQLELVPTGGLSIAHTSVELDGSGADALTDTYGILSLGTGFVFNRNLSLVPLLSIPMGLEGADPSFQLSVSYNFLGGARTSSAPRKRPATRR